MCGDFNNVLNLHDRVGSVVTLEEVDKFRHCVRECCIQEHATQGPFYIYLDNKQDGDDILFSKIDRFLVNDEWSVLNEHSDVNFFVESSVSDHNPCVIRLESIIVSKPKPFRFF